MRFKSITFKLIFWFLSISVLAGVGIAYLSYSNAKTTVEEELKTSLLAIATRQSVQINEFLELERKEVVAVSKIEELITSISLLEEVHNSYGSDTIKQAPYHQLIRKYIDNFEFSDLVVISSNGEILHSKNRLLLHQNLNTGKLKNSELHRLFNSVNIVLAPEISDFVFLEGSQEPIAFIATPLKKDRKVIGVLALQISNKEIEKVVSNHLGLKQTGETILATKKGKELVFTSSTRHAPNAAFKMRFDLNNPDLPMVQAVSGKSGTGIGIDYRGEEVLAAWSYIPALRNGMVVKIDTEEVFRPVNKLRNKLLITLGIIGLVVLTVVIFVSQDISRPLIQLTHVTDRVAGGDLTQQMLIKDKTEIGKLAQSFNQMTGQLLASQEELQEYNRTLEEKVEARTVELHKKNTQLAKIDQIIQSINEKVHLQDVLQVVLNELCSFEGVDASIVILADDEDVFEMVSAIGYDLESSSTKTLPRELVNRLYISEGTEIAPNIFYSQNLYEKIGKQNAEGMYLPPSLLTMRIVSQQHVLGYVIMLNRNKPNAFDNAGYAQLLADLQPHIVSVFSKAQIMTQLEDKNKIVMEQSLDLQEERDELSVTNEELNQVNEELSATIDQVQFQKKEIEVKNTNIIASIQYAKRIQTAILPPDELIKFRFPKSFIFFEPRDIVSGDFYWCASRNDKMIIAAIDCTGHGVPGAFMSVIGDALLNQIINVNGITAPDEILNALHKGVRNSLKQESTSNQDGMDASICVIDPIKKVVEFAGARNPLLYVKDEQLFEMKADRMSIGGLWYAQGKHFTKHVVKLDQPTTFYIFSDGYRDQFGGTKDMKFMMKNFKKLIHKISHHPMDIQRNLLEDTFMTWKGHERQIDDVLVIGFQV